MTKNIKSENWLCSATKHEILYYEPKFQNDRMYQFRSHRPFKGILKTKTQLEIDSSKIGKPFACPMKLNRNKEHCSVAGDKRINENAGLASMHTIFMREHNRIGRELKSKNPHWTSDAVFDETRLIISALHQLITYNEYLPNLIGPGTDKSRKILKVYFMFLKIVENFSQKSDSLRHISTLGLISMIMPFYWQNFVQIHKS